MNFGILCGSRNSADSGMDIDFEYLYSIHDQRDALLMYYCEINKVQGTDYLIQKLYWIITAIDYATKWTVAKAIPKVIEEAIAEFIYDEIYMYIVHCNELRFGFYQLR